MDDVRRAGRAVMLTAALFAAAAPRAAAQDAELALAVAREVERIAADRTLWPGFEPLSVPLAVYTGKDSYLIRHPSPPEGFTPLAGAGSEITVYEGRHPAMVANTSMEIGGVMTATLLLGPGAAERFALRELAAVAIHEAFHVFQRERHPGWVGNEADMLLYPVDDAGLLTLRRRESGCLASRPQCGERRR